LFPNMEILDFVVSMGLGSFGSASDAGFPNMDVVVIGFPNADVVVTGFPNGFVVADDGFPNSEVVAGDGFPNADVGVGVGFPNADVGAGVGFPNADSVAGFGCSNGDEVAVEFPNIDVAWVVGLPNIEVGSVFTGGAAESAVESSTSSMDSGWGLVLPDETISSKDPPKEKAPEDLLSDFGRSLAAVPSGLKEEPSVKSEVPPPKGFFTSLDGGGNAVSVCGLAPNGEEAGAAAKALCPAGLPKGDSAGLDAARLPNPPPPPPPEKAPKPLPEEPDPVPRSDFPGVLGCPKEDAVAPAAPNPDLPNCA
jgi:hypothetical protein